MNNLSANALGSQESDATNVAASTKNIDQSNMLLPLRSSARDVSKWSSESVLPWVEAIAKVTEQTDKCGAVIVGEVKLSECTKSPYQSFSPPTNISPYLIRSDTNHLLLPTSWDLSFVEELDAYSSLFLGQIRPLAARFESLLTTEAADSSAQVDKNALKIAYDGVKERLKHHFNEIVKIKCSIPMIDDVFHIEAAQTQVGDIARSDLDTLYDQTTAKLHSMLHSLEKKLCGDTEAPSSATSSMSKPPLPKSELGSFMTAWLRKNFTNPYPDDDELNRMAQHCGTTTKIISNWLINARTRKWRPAIQKACNLGRPADMLLEDSINFFDGAPIRPFPVSSAVPSLYSQNHSLIASSQGDFYNCHSYDDDSDMYNSMGGQSTKRMKY